MARPGAEALEGDGGESTEADRPLARPQGDHQASNIRHQTYRIWKIYKY